MYPTEGQTEVPTNHNSMANILPMFLPAMMFLMVIYIIWQIEHDDQFTGFLFHHKLWVIGYDSFGTIREIA